MSLGAWIDGLGILGPGLPDWADAAAVLAGARPFVPCATILPVPVILPAAERRRTGRVVKLALAVAAEACRSAGAQPGEIGSVFASSGSDGANCHEICVALAATPREISPTRFTNSVHNAASGYWSIAVGAMAPSQVLCAHDASFAAGLIESLVRISIEGRPVLLVAYDTEYPEPLRSKRPIPDAFGVGMVLSPHRGPHSVAHVEAAVEDGVAGPVGDARLEILHRSIPAARALPLLTALAARAPGRTAVDYLPGSRLGLEVSPCV